MFMLRRPAPFGTRRSSAVQRWSELANGFRHVSRSKRPTTPPSPRQARTRKSNRPLRLSVSVAKRNSLLLHNLKQANKLTEEVLLPNCQRSNFKAHLAPKGPASCFPLSGTHHSTGAAGRVNRLSGIVFRFPIICCRGTCDRGTTRSADGPNEPSRWTREVAVIELSVA
jgi:hypothetical protein